MATNEPVHPSLNNAEGGGELQTAVTETGAQVEQADDSRHWVLPDPSCRRNFTAAYELGDELEFQEFDEDHIGISSTTYLVTERCSGQQYSCKVIPKEQLVLEDQQDIREEVSALQRLSGSPAIVHLKDVFEDEQHISIVTEYCEGGSLHDRLLASGRCSEAEAAALFSNIIAAVDFCHQHGFVHHNICLENFLLASRSKDELSLRLADFSAAVRVGDKRMVGVTGSAPFYMAPEVVLRRSHGPEADLWSCGVLLYLLLAGEPPFYGTSEGEIFDAVLSDEPDLLRFPWQYVSSGAKELISALLVKEPSQRATAAYVMRHPWLAAAGGAATAAAGVEVADVAVDEPRKQRALDSMRSMRQVSRATALRKAAMKLVASRLPADELSYLKARFQELDSDGNGVITAAELRQALGGQLSQQQVKILLAQSDIDEDGSVDYEEFIAAAVNLQQQKAKEEQLRGVFDQFDRDGSGGITRDELQSALSHMGISDVSGIMKEVDGDGDGCIDYYEFCALMLRSQ